MVLNFWCRYSTLIINLLHEAVNDANYRLFNLRIRIQINTNMVNSCIFTFYWLKGKHIFNFLVRYMPKIANLVFIVSAVSV